ncbi:MAG: ribonuclease HII [Holosporales bacterium]|jgi:ribonuclease HII|nr:ribonuclease HII [Holosporales bacterium]
MPTFEIENLYPNDIVCGIDEAGLGAIAGPIVVASCLIKNQNLFDALLIHIDDSKKLTRKMREYLFEIMINNTDIDYGISIVGNDVIDRDGLSAAWKQGVIESVKEQSATLCLIDGIRDVVIPNCNTVSVVKGDQRSYSIAAASIIAKVTRDRIMNQIHAKHPEYGFDKHVGYGTRLHLNNLTKFGPCDFHRNSYAPVKNVGKNKLQTKQLSFTSV